MILIKLVVKERLKWFLIMFVVEERKKLMAVQNMMEHKVIVEGKPQRQPKQGDTIQYLNNKGGWEKMKITNRVSRKSGYVNVQKEEGDQRGFDLPTGS